MIFSFSFFFLTLPGPLLRLRSSVALPPILKVSQLHLIFLFFFFVKLSRRSFTQHGVNRLVTRHAATCCNSVNWNTAPAEPFTCRTHSSSSSSSNIRSALVSVLRCTFRQSPSMLLAKCFYLFCFFLCPFLFSQWKVPHSL